jgi:hypothetical protein
MNNVTAEALLTLSSLTTLLMLCCAIVIYVDFWNIGLDEAKQAPGKRCSLLRSGWFFYSNAVVCLTSVFTLFWLQ